MTIRLRRVLLGAFLIELLPIAILSVVTAWFGPTDKPSATAFAGSAGRIVAVAGGLVFGLGAGWWVARPVPSAAVMHGFLTGLFAGALEGAMLVVAAMPTDPVFIAAALGRIAAATAGGALVARKRGMAA
ncbi:MAG: hypothetical protein H0W15_00935 [Gemmatimonadales bacterium]|nr:hypothetical protein [Gemmatimonadales bacterium]